LRAAAGAAGSLSLRRPLRQREGGGTSGLSVWRVRGRVRVVGDAAEAVAVVSRPNKFLRAPFAVRRGKFFFLHLSINGGSVMFCPIFFYVIMYLIFSHLPLIPISYFQFVHYHDHIPVSQSPDRITELLFHTLFWL
jgi:hypothetical protein